MRKKIFRIFPTAANSWLERILLCSSKVMVYQLEESEWVDCEADFLKLSYRGLCPYSALCLQLLFIIIFIPRNFFFYLIHITIFVLVQISVLFWLLLSHLWLFYSHDFFLYLHDKSMQRLTIRMNHSGSTPLFILMYKLVSLRLGRQREIVDILWGRHFKLTYLWNQVYF